jgi:hypothetical protein
MNVQLKAPGSRFSNVQTEVMQWKLERRRPNGEGVKCLRIV